MQWVGQVLERLDLTPVVLGAMLVLLVVRLVIGWRRRRRPPAADQVKAATTNWLDWLDAGLLVIAVTYLAVRPFVAQLTVVTNAGMAPTLQGTLSPETDGTPDRLLVSRAVYTMRPVRRGDIVLFDLNSATPAQTEGRAVKRVIAVAGDRVAINEQGETVVNGAVLVEPYAPERSDHIVAERQVPPGTVFLLGDNRRDSNDSSRFEGILFVAERDIVGRAVAVVWPVVRVRLLATH